MDKQYITQRFINTCIREDVYGLLSKHAIINKIFELPSLPADLQDQQHWLEIKTNDRTCWLPVACSDYMQQWQLVAPMWVEKLDFSDSQADSASANFTIKEDYRDFAALLKQFDEASESALDSYLLELDCAAEHRSLARQGFASQQAIFTAPIKDGANWSERLLYADQIAAYLDHPYYPTARAKLGLTNADIQNYCPEFAPTFFLNWVAVPKTAATLTQSLPSIWPSFTQVGLEAALQQSHELFPVHPLTIPLLKQQVASGEMTDIIFAPESALEVKPTLSVRTLICCAEPSVHIKVPLIARTLGNKNIRLIKPSTIYDGYWFQQTLQAIEQADCDLTGQYYHCDESLGGHVGDKKSLAFIVRRYDADYLARKTAVPVAALGSAMPDSKPFISHLIKQYYHDDSERWLSEYSKLLCQVHLRLWIKYGIALESNQQNAVILFDQDATAMTLLMKDNDAARLLPTRFNDAISREGLESCPNLRALKDSRILVDDELALAQMFLTITLQLDLAAIVEMMSGYQLIDRRAAYQLVALAIHNALQDLSAQGFDTQLAQQILLEEDTWYIKYLLCSGSLLSKAQSGAADINKFYGKSAPNTLKLMQQLP